MRYIIVLFCYINLLHYICDIKLMYNIKIYNYETLQLKQDNESRPSDKEVHETVFPHSRCKDLGGLP